MKRLLLFLLFLTVSPLYAQQKDDVTFIDKDPAGCCFDFMIVNTHEPESPIDKIRVRSITPGVSILSGSTGPWQVGDEGPVAVEFESGGIDLEVGNMLEGFTLCFERILGVGQQFRVVWETELAGQLASSDTVELECEPLQSFCDSILVVPVSQPGQPVGSCCYDITIQNRRTPQRAIDGLTLLPFDAGIEFVGSASGPWDVSTQSAGRVSFVAQNDSLNPGQDLGGFRVCVKRTDGQPGPARLLWRTLSGQLIRCEGLATTFCQPHEEDAPDDFLHTDLGDCRHLFGFRNTHVPRSTIDGYRISVLTTGARIDSTFSITGWKHDSRTSTTVQFKKNDAPLASGDSAIGFRVLFTPPSSGSFQISRCTLSGSTEITCDTLTLQCTPVVETRCDSLFIDADEAACSYELGLVNLHQPATSISDFTLRLQTPGAKLVSTAVPFEWFIVDSTATEIQFATSTAIVPADGMVSGFQVHVTQPANASAVQFEWCTGWKDSVLCCGVDSVRCTPPDARGDSVVFASAQDYCSYDFSVTNQHIPQSRIDAFTVTLEDPATLLLNAEAPGGWTIDTLSEAQVRFMATTGGIDFGEEASGFVLHLLPTWDETRIPFTWCTEYDGSAVSCDTGSVSCEPQVVSCDVVDPVSNAERPCCFEFRVENEHLPQSSINGFNLEILTPDVTFFASTVEDAEDWTHTISGNRIIWRNPSGSVLPGEILEGLLVCFDNNAIDNGDFTVLWQTVSNGLVLCEDTLTVKCDRTLSVERNDGVLPGSLKLYQNYPNPFNPTTTIRIDVPRPSDLTLSLYDATGRLVMDLGSGHYLAGSYTIRLDASELRSGTYYYQLRSEKNVRTRPMLLLK
ncbi:T9SS type A sorting domain-containing protein [bacterium]|nr:T9SS type A sorting domain-containing protein [bacterium]